MGLIYKPFGVILGLLAGLLGKKIFDFVWEKVDDEETSWRRLIAAAAVQGVIFRVTRFAVDRWGAIGWRHLTGVWPGEKRPEPD
jgi:hypothetical protein